MEPKKFDYIDSLRGVAITMVILYHVGQAGSALYLFPASLSIIIDNGYLGVQLFFLVSAYTLTISHYSRLNEVNATRNFFIRRFFRIAPLYYLAMLYYFIQNFLGFQYFYTGIPIDTVTKGELLANLFFVNSFHPIWINHLVPGGWSVTIEFMFYLMLPLILKFVKDINGAIVFLVGALLFATILRLNHVLGHTFLSGHNYLNWFLPNQLPIFSLGIFAYFVLNRNAQLKNSTLLYLSFITLLFCYLSFSVHFIFSVSCCLLLIVLSKQPLKLVVNKVSGYIGKISFSLYLTHFAFLYWLHAFHKSDLIHVTSTGSAVVNYAFRFAIVFICSILLSHATHYLIEVPFQKLGRRLIKRWSPKEEVVLNVN